MKLFLTLIPWLFSGTPQVGSPETPAVGPPNIVLILADDLGYGDLSSYGSDFFRTPNLDALGAQGMRFTNAYANSPNCAPTRAALLSGQYAPRTGMYTVNSPKRGPDEQRVLIPATNQRSLASGVVTLAESLQAVGYATCHVGKWHLGKGAETGPEGQGFDVNIGGNQKGHPASYFSPYRNANLADGPEGEYLTHRLTNEAIAFIREPREDPFFLYLPYYTVHTPIQPHAEDLGRIAKRTPGEVHNNARYGAMVEGMDDQVGRILAALEALELDGNTIVIFLSDNGGKSPETDMLPLRGSKGMLYEGGIRVPMVVRWPGVVPTGSVSAEPVITLDLYPTLVAAAGGDLPKGPIDGVDLGPLLRDPDSDLKRDALFWHFPAYLNGYKGMADEGYRTGWRATPSSAIRAGKWKLIEYFEDGKCELFDLASDPGEKFSLAQKNPEKKEELLSRLHAWQAATGAPTKFAKNPAYKR
jgi:arylsulfatase A-like enzyme